MKFENRNIGVFDLLSVQMLADEVFDAGRLRQETLRMVERGSRRLVIDLGAVDYLYSDSINALVALNRRMLESSGRMGILVPNNKVYDILVRAGLENIMRLYRSEADLLNDSRELMRQSSAWTRPAELLSAASASQMISANVVVPKNPGENRETTPPGQRVPRKRVGSRVELRPRRRGGRSMDIEQPTSEFQLPPSLPNTPGESTTLRMLSQESSAFDNPNLPQPAKSTPAPPPEPTIFQAPEPPREESYRGTDPWLLTMPHHPTAPAAEVHRPAPDAASSSFLPKVDPAASGTQDPQSNFPTALHWDNLPDSPSSPAPTKESVHEDWAATQPMQTISLANFSPEAPPAAPVPPSVPDIKSVIFYNDPPVKPSAGASSSEPPPKPLETKPLVWSDPKAATPPAPAPSPEPPRAAPETVPSTPALDHWFASSKSAPPAPVSSPAPVQPTVPGPVPLAAKNLGNSPSSAGPTESSGKSPSKSDASALDSWFTGSATPAKPVETPAPARAPEPPAPGRRSMPAADPSGLDAWFGASKSAAKPSPTNEPPPPAAAPAPARAPEPTVDFSGRAAKPAPSGLDDWFAGTKVPAVPPKAPTPAALPPEPAKPVPPPAATTRVPEPPAADAWFAGAAPRTPVVPEPPPAKPLPATPASDPWMTPGPKTPTEEFPASNAIGGTMWLDPKPPRKVLMASKEPTSFLDLDDLTGEPRRSRKPLWIALSVLVALVVGLILALSGGSSSGAPEVPNQTTVETPAEPVAEPAPPPPEAAAPEAPAPAAPSVVKPKVAPKEAPKSEAAPPVAAPVVEDHAPVKIFVTSRPSGAVVLLDGSRVGTTPCEVTFKRAGKLEFTLAGYRQQSKDIDPDETRGTVNVQLFADAGAGGNVGRIYITSAPVGAEIVVGGKVLGKTPRLVELPVGSQKVTVRSGVLSKTRSLDIQSGTNSQEFFSL